MLTATDFEITVRAIHPCRTTLTILVVYLGLPDNMSNRLAGAVATEMAGFFTLVWWGGRQLRLQRGDEEE
jgi:hypothetical protein